jgi:hypothetical protein
MEMARNHAAWVRQQTSIRTYPAQEFLRVSEREEPRDWEARWAEAKAETASIPGVHPTLKIALLNHPIWRKLSRFDQPYPPFDFGSGMGVKPISRSDALDLGFDLDPNNDPMQQPLHRSLNDGLEVTPQISDPVMKAALKDRLGRFGEWDGEKMVFTDPDGTKPYTAAKLAEIWAKPAPPEHDVISQKEALDAWDGGITPDPGETRVTLRKLFDRIESNEQPPELWRVIPMNASDTALLIRGLAMKRMVIPGNVAGWELAATPQHTALLLYLSWKMKAPAFAELHRDGFHSGVCQFRPYRCPTRPYVR